MPEIVLRTCQSYLGQKDNAEYTFRRGVVYPVTEQDYHDLLRTGYFSDPHRQCDFILPSRLGAVPNGSTVPVFRDVGLGDVLMVLIPLAELANRRPNLRFVYATHSAYVPMLREMVNAKIAEIRPIATMRGDWAWAIDLRGYSERAEGAHTRDRIDIFCKYLLGGPPSSYAYPCHVPNGWAEEGRAIAEISGKRPVVGYAPRASMAMRSWGFTYHRRFVELAVSAGWQVVILDRGSPKKSFGDSQQIVDLRGKLSIHELAKVTSAVDVVMTPDTGNVHLAEALGTKTVAFFTTVDPRLRIGHYTHVRALYPDNQLPCLNCTYTPRCGESPPMPCAKLTTPERAWREVEWSHEHDPPFGPYAWLGADNPEPAAQEEEVLVV